MPFDPDGSPYEANSTEVNTDPAGAPEGMFKVKSPFSKTEPQTKPCTLLCGVTVTVAVKVPMVVLVAVNVGTFPVPEAAKPIAGVSLDQT